LFNERVRIGLNDLKMVSIRDKEHSRRLAAVEEDEFRKDKKKWKIYR